MIEIPDIGYDFHAKHAFLCHDTSVVNFICESLGRSPNGKVVKVFYGNPLKEGETLNDALWGDNHDPLNNHDVRKNSKLLISTKIQNILWKNDLAPRVYLVFEAIYKGNRVACQLTDFITGEHPKDSSEVSALYDRIVQIGKQYRFSAVKNIMSRTDFMNGKTYDLQPFTFDEGHDQVIKEIYWTRGKYGKVYYQDVPELGLHGGPRKSLDRIKYLALDRIDFKEKVVWDVGCAGGFFCRYATGQGAKRVFGFDMEEPTHAAYLLSNYLGYFNIDFNQIDLKKPISGHYPRPNITFFLSMNFHVPIPERILESDIVIFEDNGKESRVLETLGKPWTDHFSRIEFIGRAKDHGDKSIYHLYK